MVMCSECDVYLAFDIGYIKVNFYTKRACKLLELEQQPDVELIFQMKEKIMVWKQKGGMLLSGACVEIDEVTYEAEVWGCSARTTQGTCGGASNKHCYWDTTTKMY